MKTLNVKEIWVIGFWLAVSGIWGAVAAPPPIHLQYAAALADGAAESDGVTFIVRLRRADSDDWQELARERITRCEWQPKVVDLTAFAGQEVVLRLAAAPGPTTQFDWACWASPRIVRGDDVLVDLTRTKVWHAGIADEQGREWPMDSDRTGASFALSRRHSNGISRLCYLSHPPWKEAAPAGETFAEFKLVVGAEQAPPPARDPMPVADWPGGPFPMGIGPCFRLPGPIDVDGSLDDWPKSFRKAALMLTSKEQMVIEHIGHRPGWKAGWVGPHDLSAAYLVGWDDTCLYLAEVRHDDRLQFMDVMSEDFRGSDSLTVCLSAAAPGDAAGEAPCILAVIPQGEEDQPCVRRVGGSRAGAMDTGATGVRVAPRLYSDGWVMEAAIPFKLLGVTPAVDRRLGLQLIATDSDTPMERHYEMAWQPNPAPGYRRNPADFGMLVLCRSAFPWLELKRRTFAVGETPQPRLGVFSLGDPVAADAVLRLRPPKADGPVFAAVKAGVSGQAIPCEALSRLGRQALAYRLTAGGDVFTGSLPLDVVEDRVRADLSPLVQPPAPTLIPSVATTDWRYRVTPQDDGRTAFECVGDDVATRYLVRPGAGFDIELYVGDTLVYRTEPAATGPRPAAPADASAATNVKLDGDTLRYTVSFGTDASVAYEVSIRGRSLVIEVSSESAAFSEFRGPLFGLPGERVPIPYLDSRMAVWRLGNTFLGTSCDWTVTGASSLQPLGVAVYGAKTDRTRNPLHERLYLTLSRDPLEALPNLPNPPSPFLGLLSRKVVLDVWSWGQQFADTRRYLDVLKGYGVDHLAIIYHVWQCHGYDNGLPQHVPANAARGGDDGMRQLADTARRNGYRLALHENYIDYYPNFPDYSDDAVALDAAGQKINAWYMPSTGIQSFRLKPSWIERYAADQTTEVNGRYGTTAAYLDVQSVALPFQIDFDARAPGAASMLYSFETITELFSCMRETHDGPLFGEGNSHSIWAGRIDGCEAQIGGRGGELHPLLVDFDLLKVHPLAVNHGVGYYSRWQRQRSGRLTGEEMDKYRAQELAYGHAGFINTGAMGQLSQALREYYLTQPLQASYALSTPRRIEYLFDPAENGSGTWVSARVACRTDAPRKLHVVYANGLELWVNDGRDNWHAGGRRLPPWGFVARGPGLEAWTARPADGLVADCAVIDQRIFVDPRTADVVYRDRASRVQITPRPPTVTNRSEGLLEVGYVWQVDAAPDADYNVFVHFTDAQGRILWQDDHRPAAPTSQWQPGTVYREPTRRIGVPPGIRPGVYELRVGLFLPKQGRLVLNGDDAGGRSYRTGRLHLRPGEGGARGFTFVPSGASPDGVEPGRNPVGTMVDFGVVRSDVALVVGRSAKALDVMPIPHGHHGRVELNVAQLLPGCDQGRLQVTALGPEREARPQPSVQYRDSWLQLDCRDPDAWYYRIAAPD